MIQIIQVTCTILGVIVATITLIYSIIRNKKRKSSRIYIPTVEEIKKINEESAKFKYCLRRISPPRLLLSIYSILIILFILLYFKSCLH